MGYRPMLCLMNRLPPPSFDWRDDLRMLREDLEFFGLPLPKTWNPDDLVSPLKDSPAQSTLAFVAITTVLFYLAERKHNPKVQDIYDALIYCTTNLSVGYSDIFARTPLGKVIGSLLMTFGPALAAKTLDGRAAAKEPAADDKQAEILSTLRQILVELRTQKSTNDTNGHE
jgi:hypothetical protein